MLNAADFDELKQLRDSRGAGETLRALADILRRDRQWHALFDARLLDRKHQLGLPLLRPASVDDVPAELRATFQETYLSAAREAGAGLLTDGDIAGAWMYLQLAREPQTVAAALDELPDRFDDPQFDSLIRIALFEGVHPEKGVRMLLATCGVCNTITALDQALLQLPAAQRDACARTLVRHVHGELCENLRTLIRQRGPADETAAQQSLTQLLAGREWLFENGAYHVDLSHLQAVIRFARSIDSSPDDLKLARELSDYGLHLPTDLQSAGDPPFTDFYPAHLQLFNVLLDEQRSEGLAYFRRQLDETADPRDRPPLAYVLVDLLTRVGLLDEAIAVASEDLLDVGDELRQAFAELCARAGRFDRWRQEARDREDLVGFTAALLAEESASTESNRQGSDP